MSIDNKDADPVASTGQPGSLGTSLKPRHITMISIAGVIGADILDRYGVVLKGL